MSTYYVVSEDGDSLRVEADSAQRAADMAIEEWDLIAEPGYRFHVFAAEDAKVLKTALHTEPELAS